jgi:hypothetical protein
VENGRGGREPTSSRVCLSEALASIRREALDDAVLAAARAFLSLGGR